MKIGKEFEENIFKAVSSSQNGRGEIITGKLEVATVYKSNGGWCSVKIPRDKMPPA